MERQERVLVVFYSESGHTAAAARRLAERLPARLESLRAPGLRRSFWSYCKRAFGALRGRGARIAEPAEDPAAYDIVVIGTPIWAGRMATPVVGYLQRMAGRLDRVAVLATHGGSPPDRVYKRVSDMIGKPLVGQTAISDADRKEGEDKGKVDRLALTIDEALDELDQGSNVEPLRRPLTAA